MVQVTKVNMPSSKFSVKCPYSMIPTRIVVHNTYNDASAMVEVSYMMSNNNSVSFHCAVDDVGVVQGIDFNRNAWHAGDGNGKGNREGIAIEICYSKSGGSRFESAKKIAAEYIALLLKQFGWGINRVTKHQDYSGKYCPHRILDEGWQSFLDAVQVEFDKLNMSTPAPNPAPQPQPVKEEIAALGTRYRVHTTQGWLAWVTGYNNSDGNGYAGLPGHAIDAIQIDGNVTYRVQTEDGRWWGWITGYNNSDGNGYAGVYGRRIIAVQIQDKTYRVKMIGSNDYLGWITHYNTVNGNGYAGNRKPIDRLQIQ